MNRRALAASVALVAACAIAALPAPAAKRSECQRLTGVDRAPDRNVKLVVRRNSEARRLPDGARAADLVGCVLPRGLVFTLASRRGVEDDWAQSFGFTVHHVKGRIVLLDTSGTDAGYSYDDRTMVWNLGTGRSYTVAHACGNKYDACQPVYDRASVGFVTRDGRAVVALERWSGGPVPAIVIARFAADGTPRILDSGTVADLPTTSLTLTGNVATWTHADQQRSAAI